MKRLASILFLVLGFSLAGAACNLTTTVQVPANTAVQNANTVVCAAPSGSISYAGQDGKNALELLQANHIVDVSAAGFVNAINDVKPGDRQFWALYVNCKQAEVGAKDYQAKNSDVIYWQLESF